MHNKSPFVWTLTFLLLVGVYTVFDDVTRSLLSDWSKVINPGRSSHQTYLPGLSDEKPQGEASSQPSARATNLLDKRRRNMENACAMMSEQQVEDIRQQSPTIYAVIVDDDRKLMYCRLAKAGSTSAVAYFTNLNRKYDDGGLRRYDIQEVAAKNHTGFYYITNMTVDEAVSRYRQYKKILFVRHPLQRLISSYFYSCVSSHRPFAKGVTEFDEFVSKLFLLKFPLANIHWRSYQHSCHPCLLQYDYIIKTENSDDEMPELSAMLGLGSNVSLPHKFGNPNTDAAKDMCTHYDSELRTFAHDNPNLMEDLLKDTAMDMDMFGYSWERNGSVCGQ